MNTETVSVAPKVIKRYQNRKLYDTSASTYVTLSDVYSFIENGETIRVVNNTTQEDITNSVLLTALTEKVKGANSNGDVVTMLEYVANYIKGGNNGQI